MELAFLVFATLTGLVVGSFLNVVIWRLPRGESVVSPRSRCPGCEKLIAWFDNIPVFSWLVLGAKCRHCKTSIAWRYPLVELLTGLLFALAWLQYRDHPATAAFVAVALAALLAISFIDWDHKIIPDRISKPGILLAVALAPVTVLHPPDWLDGVKPAMNAWLHAGAGALAGALLILAIRWIGGWILRKEAMGLGDVKLMAFIGALVGPTRVLYVLILASLSGAVIGILRLLWARGRPLPMTLAATGDGLDATFSRARIDGEHIEVVTSDDVAAPEVGKTVRLHMQLPAAGILEDTDADVVVGGLVERVTPEGKGQRWRIHVADASEVDRDRLGMYAMSFKYVPFGPFLAVGGALALLYGDWVVWVVTEWYPSLFLR